MRVLLIAAIAFAATAEPAAASKRLSDREYVQLARCIGLTGASGGDTAALETVMRRAQRQRTSRIYDRGFTARRQASLAMRAAQGEERAALETEMGSRCAFT